MEMMFRFVVIISSSVLRRFAHVARMGETINA